MVVEVEVEYEGSGKAARKFKRAIGILHDRYYNLKSMETTTGFSDLTLTEGGKSGRVQGVGG